ncbi:MAG: hypothetical protein IJ733_05525, partial [Lachnospiraceae bacterium]|nr:hypothetical protein [Lachnospiraceae bacterium]
VSKGGVIRADKPGSAMITVTGGGKDLKYQVKVYKLNMKNRVKQIRKRELKQGMNTLEKILAVHYWMSRHIAYDTNQRGSGAKILLTGGGVCADYSRGFGYMMNELKVPYAAMIGTVNGILHEWSMVKYKGKWYHIDVTFDDGGLTNGRSRTIPRLYYFMIASKLMGKDHQFDKKYVYAKKATSTKFDNKRKSSDFTRFPMD